MTYRDFENIQRSNEEFDGLVVLLSLWAYDNHASYHLHNWEPVDDERMMMAIYYAEQVHPFPRYKNDLVKFKADWAAQAYDPGGASLTFAPADVEELEVLCITERREIHTTGLAFNGPVFTEVTHTITDIVCQHSVKTGEILFLYELDNSGKLVVIAAAEERRAKK